MDYPRRLQFPLNGFIFSLLFAIFCSFGSDVGADSLSPMYVMVESPFGKIQGLKKTDNQSGHSYLSFKAIPYAKPPVGELRFAKPQAHPGIVGTFKATSDDKIICPHSDKLTYGERDFIEDCLVLNIYVKNNVDQADSLKKVFVFIHGGGFRTAYATLHDPTSFVIGQDVLVVTLNYRLGILGFLSTENEASPGNYGLWDQTLGIKWVKDNIREFGGDPNDITIAGESAGGMSVGFQAISPHTKGLFTKVYAQSGVPTSNSAISFNAQKHALELAKSAGCWDKSADDVIALAESTTVMDCLRKAPLSAITAFSGFSLVDVQFTPRVDGDFIPDMPKNILEDDEYLESIGFYDRTYMIAINNNEAQASAGFLQVLKTIYTDPGIRDQKLTEIGNEYIKIRLGNSAATNVNVTTKIKTFYERRFQGDSSFVEMIADVAFLLPAVDFLRAASRRKSCRSCFLYFDYFPRFMKGAYTGFPHGADLLYLFDMEISSLENIIHAGMTGHFDEEDLELKRKFSSLIGEFVRSGNPGNALEKCGWPKYDVINSRYLNFNLNPWIRSFLEKDRQDLWYRKIPRLNGGPEIAEDDLECGMNGGNSGKSKFSMATQFAFSVTLVYTIMIQV